MPLSTVSTFEGVPAKRKAHEATLPSGLRSFKRVNTCSGMFDKRPPSNGSITTTGMFRLLTCSYR